MTDQFVAAMFRYERHVKVERRADWRNCTPNLAATPAIVPTPNSCS
jgi:hypothetical protein